MTSKKRNHDAASHSHGEGARLAPPAREILTRGLSQLVEMTEGLEFKPVVSQRYPLPLCRAAYRSQPGPEDIRAEVRARMHADPVSVLEAASVLAELFESNQPDTGEYILEDGKFTDVCFQSKRLNGWIAVMGDGDRSEIETAVNARWQFRFIAAPQRPTGLYVIMNMLARYSFVYGRIAAGDSHALAHFVEDFTPGVLVCRGAMTDLELTLSLAAMKMGVPAVVEPGYPFPFGRTLEVSTVEDVAEAVVGFPNVRRLLAVPDMPQYPDYCSPDFVAEKFEPALVWGDTAESFFVFRKADVPSPGSVKVAGRPEGPMGVIVSADAEPLDAFDRAYIERTIAMSLLMMSGVIAAYNGERLTLRLRDKDGVPPQRIGEVLVAAVRHEFPKIRNVSAEIIFDREALAGLVKGVREEKRLRREEAAGTTEETLDRFYTCVGCSPFAPDHVCILTPERPPQCGRPFEQIKTGALYGYDDMTNIHHSRLQRDINSFGFVQKGARIDASTGEWSGINAAAAALTGGRTFRVLLHSIDDNPHTGCGCFNLVMFKTEKPRPGIAIMEAGYQERCPDGRSWRDLHYSLAGKQTRGIAGASAAYLKSPKFLKAHGGWRSVVWVTPKIAAIMGADLPAGVEVGPETAGPNE